MTIPVDVAELDLATDGATKVFNLSGAGGALYFMAASDLKVWFVDADGAGTLLTYGVDYTIGGNGRTGTGTLTTLADDAYADDGYLAIRRNTPRTQPEAWADNDGFAAATMQNAQDRGRLIDQDAAAAKLRALRVPYYEAPPAELPSKPARANKIQVWDENGDYALSTKTVDQLESYLEDAATVEQATATAVQARNDAVNAVANVAADLWPRPISFIAAAEPGAPNIGDRGLLDETNATHPNQLIEYTAEGWRYSGVPKDGQPIWDETAKCIRRFSDAAGKWKKSLNKAIFTSWFVAVSGVYDYAAADTFAAAAGILHKGDVDIDVSGIADAGVTFAGDYKPARGIITRGAKTLTFARFHSAPYQAFDADGTGAITFTRFIGAARLENWGVVGDSADDASTGTDDTNAFQRATSDCAASGVFLTANPSCQIKITAKVTIPPTLQADFRRARVIPTGIANDVALKIDGAVTGYIGTALGHIKNLRVWNKLKVDAGDPGGTNPHVDVNTTMDGVEFGQNTAYCTIENMDIQGFREGMIWSGSNLYLTTFRTCFVSNCWKSGVAWKATTNSGEKIRWEGGAIANIANKNGDAVGFRHASTSATLELEYSGSVDYCDFSFDWYSGHLLLNPGHLENNNNNAHIKLNRVTSKPNSDLTMIAGALVGGPGSAAWTGTSTESSTVGRTAFITTTGGSSTITLIRTKTGRFQTTAQTSQIVKSTDGIANLEIDIRPIIDGSNSAISSWPMNVSLETNELYIAASGAATGWDQTNIGGTNAVSADTTAGNFQAPDTGARKITIGAVSANGTLFQKMSVRGKKRIVAKMHVKTDATFLSGVVQWRLQFYTAKDDLILDQTSARTCTGASQPLTEVPIMLSVPVGADYVRMSVYWNGSPTANAFFWVSNEHVWMW